jgi:hypothetical protein
VHVHPDHRDACHEQQQAAAQEPARDAHA